MKLQELPATAATGALGPVITKLTALQLGSEYKLRRQTRSDIKFIKSKFKSMYSLLSTIWEREEEDPDEACMLDYKINPTASSPFPLTEITSTVLKMEAWQLADDMEDVVDNFVLLLSRESRKSGSSIQMKTHESPFQDLRKRADDVLERCRNKWKRKNAQTICSLFSTKDAVSSSSKLTSGEPRPFILHKDVSQIVDLDGPMHALIKFLVEKGDSALVQPQLKMASIVGIAGMGKTTLANLLYNAIEETFQSRAFVSVTPRSNMKEILTSILEQVEGPLVFIDQVRTEKCLIDEISNFLSDKRYLVIVDDIWHCEEWEIIRKSLPENNLGSRIVTTTRINGIAEKWRADSDALVYKIDRLDDDAVAQIIKMKSDMVGGGFDYDHPVVHMCGGMPLAIVCMLSAVKKELEQHGQQGRCVNTCDVQDKIAEQVKRNGIQNMAGFEPLAESLHLSYDGLPDHILKTCLLYCSIYPENHKIERDHLVRKWIAEGFVYKEEAANCYVDELAKRGLMDPAEEGGYFYEFVKRGLIKEEEVKGCIDALLNRGLTLPARDTGAKYYRMHPMMLNFLRCKSRQDNFVTCTSDIPSSYATRIRRLSIDSGAEEQVNFSGMDWSRLRSVVVFGDAKRVPLKHFERLRVLDLKYSEGVQDANLEDICGLLGLRHLWGHNGEVQRLRTMVVSNTDITKLPSQIRNLQHLETLDLSGAGITELPGEIVGGLQRLRSLDVSNTGITRLPSEIRNLQHLETLDVSHTGITKLPSELGSLKHLKTLNVSDTKLTEELPREIIRGLHLLETLDVSHTGISKLPSEIGNLERLKTLDVSHTKLTEVPREIIEKLQHLETLDMSHTGITKLPSEIGSLEHLKTLDVSHTKLKELPRQMGTLRKLETLNARDNEMLTELPREIGNLEHLEILDLDRTGLTKLPREIGGLKQLKSLILHTRLRMLPLEVAQLSKSLCTYNFGKVVMLPECVCQAWKSKDLVSSLTERGELLYLDMIDQFVVSKGGLFEAALIVATKHMHIPEWIKQHFSDLAYLEIRICKLEEEDLKILRGMPNLQTLVLRFEVVPTKPVAIIGEGFARLQVLFVESRVPRVTFLKGAMPKLKHLQFMFQYYHGPANEDPVGITHLLSLQEVVFWRTESYSEHWPCISSTIDIVRKEAQEHRNRIRLQIVHTTEYHGGHEISEESIDNWSSSRTSEVE